MADPAYRAYRTILLLAVLGLACPAGTPPPKVADDQSKLKKATDLFWALQDLGFIGSKEKPVSATHGCAPTEYLVQKGEATFRLSIFECPTVERAVAITENEKTRHIGALLQNHHEGGVLRRNSLQIIVRMTKGQAADADAFIEALGGM